MSEKLLDAIGEISETFVAEAAPGTERSNIRRFPGWIKWAAAAACFGLILAVGSHTSSTSPDLPLLTIGEDPISGMGFEGYMAYDVFELVNANPWSEKAKLKTLPVYKNPCEYSMETMMVSNTDIDLLKENLLEIASRLGLSSDLPILNDNDLLSETQKEKMQEKVDRMEAQGYTFPESYFDPSFYFVEADGIRVEMDLSMSALIRFEPAIALPEEFHFTHYASYDEKYAAAQYLLEKYETLINMEDPVINISGGDYNIYAEQSHAVSFYDGTGDLQEQIYHYNFEQASFSCDDEGKLFIARPVVEKELPVIGEYPLITAKEAKELLLEGKYITTCPDPIAGEEYVKDVELIYRTGRLEYYIPYYRFYVEMPQWKTENGLNTYGAYYVPAIEQQYIADIPQWDGSFNS